jgi:hypothetical protein
MERSSDAPNDPYYMHKQLLPFSFEVASAIWHMHCSYHIQLIFEIVQELET